MGNGMPSQRSMREGFVLPLHLARPMVEAAAAPYPATAIRPLLQRFGFDGLTYLVARDDGAGQSGRIVWSTHSPAWSALYRRAAYAAFDPRLTNTRHRVTPYVWDAAALRHDGRHGEFLRAAAQSNIRSGVVVALHDGLTGHVALAFDSGLSPVPRDRQECVAETLGDLLLTAVSLHEGVLSWRIARAATRPVGAPTLTRRECDCLKMAARGMTSADIGNKLSLSERTINFHFGNLRRKLGALNRPEAIAKGAALGLVTPD